MGALFGKNSKKTAPSRITDHDKAVLQLKQQRDRLKQYQKRIELQLENDRLLAKKCLQQGRKDRAKLLLRKKKYQESLLTNADKQLDNLEKLAADLEFAQVEMKVLDGLKQGNAALKKVHEMLDINEVERIMDETREGIEKQQEIDAILTDVLTPQDEEDVLAELDALEAEEDRVQLPEVPTEVLPPVDDEAAAEEKAETKAISSKTKKVLVEA
ncbi:charged multivesicular body protein 6-A [Drosophila guanche]|uniref:Blast:WD repeat-containing protein 65 n=1 Tax=Drosophila guanche TaxID=7266 RepID=A0A3B0JNU6_DROGU|nr:charged multivesicular body protein 6-A [Drosophila guanche]SPP74331.1 blast:WD repeat-containing protein 65 [Drosophila guanche]